MCNRAFERRNIRSVYKMLNKYAFHEVFKIIRVPFIEHLLCGKHVYTFSHIINIFNV